MTRDEALALFDEAARRVKAQGKPSYYRPLNLCMYRDGNGNKCAIGMFIDDERYKPAYDSGQYDISQVLAEATPYDENDLNTYNAFFAMRCAHDDAAMTSSDETFLTAYEEQLVMQRKWLEGKLVA